MTIIIPTRGRPETLHYAILNCVLQEYDDLEILVSDNCSDDGTEEVVKAFLDKRIRYIRTPRRLSMRANFEFALAHVQEGFVGFMGDDDALFPEAIKKAAAFIGQSGMKALTSTLATYRWPNAPDAIKNTGKLQFSTSGDTCRNSAEFIDKALRGTGSFYVHDLPSVYYGFVHVSLLKPHGGTDFFNSLSPDAYSAFAVAAQVPEYGYLAEPLFVIGASGRSNGVSHFHKDANKQESMSFAVENDFPFHPDYLLCQSISLCVHEAFRQVADRYPDLIQTVHVDPMSLIRNMAREVDQYNGAALLESALFTGTRSGIDAEEILKEFHVKKVSFPEAMRNNFDHLVSRIMKGNKEKKKQAKYVTVNYPDMTVYGVEDCHHAALFFQKELEKINAN